MKALLIACAVAGGQGSASAEIYIVQPPEPEEPEPIDPPPTHDTLFGFRIGGGVQPYDGRDLQVMSLALAVEHRVHGSWRIAGEYEYVWLGVRDTEAEGQHITDGSGHRTNLVIRRALMESRHLADKLRLYVDLEVGGGLMLATEPMAGTIVLPHALVGLRFGYDFIKMRSNTRASAVWEPELLARAIATPGHSVGWVLGVGMAWGD